MPTIADAAREAGLLVETADEKRIRELAAKAKTAQGLTPPETAEAVGLLLFARSATISRTKRPRP